MNAADEVIRNAILTLVKQGKLHEWLKSLGVDLNEQKQEDKTYSFFAGNAWCQWSVKKRKDGKKVPCLFVSISEDKVSKKDGKIRFTMWGFGAAHLAAMLELTNEVNEDEYREEEKKD